MALIDIVKTSLRISDPNGAYNDQLTMLINAAVADLGLAGVVNIDTTNDALVQQAVASYCMLHMGIPDDAERLKASYDEQKAQLSMATGYTDWGTE